MSGSTDRAGLLQFIQIMIAVLVIVCQSYAFKRDIQWTKLVKQKKPEHICPFILKHVDPRAYDSIALHLVGNPDFFSKGRIKPGKLRSTADEKLYRDNILRDSFAEKTSLTLTVAEFLMLTAHLIAACWSSNYAYRTKWTAFVQGVTIFTSGFSAIFIAISAHHFAEGFEVLASKFKICTHLLACSLDEDDFKSILHIEEFSAQSGKAIRDKVQKFAMCQEFKLKFSCTILAGIKVALAFVIICNAMDLTTLYDEEDVDEEERARRENFNFNANKGLRAKGSKTRNLDAVENADEVIHTPEITEA